MKTVHGSRLTLRRLLGLALLLLIPGGGCLNITPLAQCLEQSDCDQSIGQKCEKGICVGPSKPPPSCQRACTTSADCPGAPCTNTSCIGGVCLAPKWHTVSRTQAADPPVDILFVVDNSGSMKEEQEKLARNFEKFIQVLTSRDVGNYQIGIISTDMDSPLEKGKLQAKAGYPKIINRSQLPGPKVIEAFKANIDLGVRGTSYEKPLDAMRAALSPKLLNDPNGNQGFLRKDSMLVVFFVGDEDDCSHNGSIAETELDSEVCRLPKEQILKDDQGNPIPDAKGNPVHGHMEDLTPTSVYINFLKSLGRQVYVSGLIGDPLVLKDGTQQPIDPAGGCLTHPECRNNSDAHKCVYNSPSTRKCGGCTSKINPQTKRPDADAVPGFRLYELFKAFGGAGSWHPICGNDVGFGEALLSTAHTLSDQLQSLQLSPAPLPNSSASFRVEMVISSQNTSRPLSEASTTTKNCTSDMACGGSFVCGHDGRCRGDGWVYFPVTTSNAVPRIRLSGAAQSSFVPGAILKVTYPIAP